MKQNLVSIRKYQATEVCNACSHYGFLPISNRLGHIVDDGDDDDAWVAKVDVVGIVCWNLMVVCLLPWTGEWAEE